MTNPIERAARAVAIAAGDGCFDRLDANDCGCLDNDCADHEDAAYYRTLAAAAIRSLNAEESSR
jgi:hypothetical protein